MSLRKQASKLPVTALSFDKIKIASFTIVAACHPQKKKLSCDVIKKPNRQFDD